MTVWQEIKHDYSYPSTWVIALGPSAAAIASAFIWPSQLVYWLIFGTCMVISQITLSRWKKRMKVKPCNE